MKKGRIYQFGLLFVSAVLLAGVLTTSCKKEEETINVSGVSLNKSELIIIEENSETLVATVFPSDATNRKVIWCSDNTNIATVNNTGKVTAVSPGSATITVTTEDGNKTAVCNITVKAKIRAVEGVSLNINVLTLEVGSSETLTATVFPENATNRKVTWKSNHTSVATVDNTGKVTALSQGTAAITVTTEDGNKTAVCNVTTVCNVTVPVAVEGVSLNKTTLTLAEGSSETLTATVSPSNAGNKNVSWSSDNTAVATVDNTGKVTAVSPGTATVTVTTEDENKTAVCNITVKAKIRTVEGVSLNKNTLNIKIGSSETLIATVFPDNATNKKVTWSSNHTSVATVDNTGKVTALKIGTAAITVTTEDGNKTAVCNVTVIPIAVEGVSLNKTTLTLEEGSSGTLTATVSPDNATNKNLSWASDDENVATVDAAGTVTAIAAGTANITVTTEDGGFTAGCVVKVKKSFTVNGVSFDMVFVKGGTFDMGATPEQGSDAQNNEKPVHQVTLTQDYYIGKFEVTQGLWKAVMGSNPSSFKKGDNYPVENVSWDDCQSFIKKLNAKTGKTFSLPTEAQWEYAARGGAKSKHYKYSGGNTLENIAWYTYNSDETHSVGQKQPNELGIYDMSGNVWEWCKDWYGNYGAGSQTNPAGPSSGSYRVLRGGGWSNYAHRCRVTYRDYRAPAYRNYNCGFRLVLVP